MKIGQIGYFISDVENVDFSSHSSLFDYDMILINLNKLIESYHVHGDSDESIYTTDFDLLMKDCQRRFNELQIFVNTGKKLVIIVPEPKVIINYNSTARRTTINLLLPFFNFTTQLFRGKTFEIVQTSKLASFFNKHKSHFNYNAVVNENVDNSLANVREFGKSISFYQDNIIYLPSFHLHAEKKEVFLEDLYECFTLLRPSLLSNFPDWFNTIFIFDEEDISNKIISLNQQIVEAQNTLKLTEELFDKLQSLKTLLSETGKNLEFMVETIFKEMGFESLPTADNRDDLILKFEDKIFVVEIKGLKNSAGERNSAQLEKWVSEYLINNDLKPKGILIVNPYKDIPLFDRTEPAFPNQMLKYAENREHCLMTTTQLLGAYIDFKSEKLNVKSFTKSVENTNGIYQQYLDITKFVNQVN